MPNKKDHSFKTGLPSFAELINLLGKVKLPKDITQELTDELLGVAISTFIKVEIDKDPKVNYFDALQIARISVLQYFDVLIADALQKSGDKQ